MTVSHLLKLATHHLKLATHHIPAISCLSVQVVSIDRRKSSILRGRKERPTKAYDTNLDTCLLLPRLLR